MVVHRPVDWEVPDSMPKLGLTTTVVSLSKKLYPHCSSHPAVKPGQSRTLTLPLHHRDPGNLSWASGGAHWECTTGKVNRKKITVNRSQETKRIKYHIKKLHQTHKIWRPHIKTHLKNFLASNWTGWPVQQKPNLISQFWFRYGYNTDKYFIQVKVTLENYKENLIYYWICIFMESKNSIIPFSSRKIRALVYNAVKRNFYHGHSKFKLDGLCTW